MHARHDATRHHGRTRAVLRHPATRAVLAVLAMACGGATVMLTLTIGSCGALGGTCPAAPVPWWENDWLGGAAVGLALLVAPPLLAWRPDRRGLAAASVAVLGTLPIAWVLAEIARTGVA
jgi:hypothetical protein